jgi:hypothetical protein
MIIEEHTHEKSQHTTAWLDEDDVPAIGERVIVQVIVHDYAPEEVTRHTVLSNRRKVSRKKGSRRVVARR